MIDFIMHEITIIIPIFIIEEDVFPQILIEYIYMFHDIIFKTSYMVRKCDLVT